MELKAVASALARLAGLLLSVSFVAFLLVEFSPLDPIAQYINDMQGISDEQIAQISQLWGQDQPWWQRYFNWLGGVLTGDFGTSYIYRREVVSILSYAVVNSLLLMALAWTLSAVIGYGLGVVAGASKGSLLDRIIVVFTYVLTSTPTFVVGLVLITIFAVYLGWVPVGMSQPVGVTSGDVTFADRLAHAILPALTVALVGIATVTLHTRQAMISFMESDVARFARSRGMTTWQIVRKQGFRNTILPAVMLQFTSLSTLVGGSVLAESVFSYHGLGSTVTQAGLRSDVPLLLGAIVVISSVVFIGNTIADILADVLEPRIARSREVHGEAANHAA
ncbi:ABC transporter permease [Corynebacterium breve]|uniref:ABC transporter permease n=1 Tax=Corynebacterium breve TaxID=3049799 RepID=A0ABY8VFJ2_9CORY|nr:ABC transporter permease [Corynebacterium breve]WIM68112.1 ABC transporter permease [Corynebacterium breve]